MTTAADDAAVEEAFEAHLAGRPVPDEAAGLAAFAEAVRSAATRPGRPNAALADLLATGLLTDQPTPSARTAHAARRPPASRGRTRRRPAMFLPALLAKIASAGAVAQAATGAGLVLVAFTGAGAAGVLPDSVQHGFATVAGTVGVEVDDPQAPAADDTMPAPTGAETGGSTGEDGAEQNADGTEGATGDPADGATGEDGGATGGTAPLSCPPDENFGSCVSDAAHDGGVDGRQVSQAARDRNEDRKAQWSGAAPTTPAQQPTGDDGAADDSAEEAGQHEGDEGGSDDEHGSSGHRGNSDRGGRGGHGGHGDR